MYHLTVFSPNGLLSKSFPRQKEKQERAEGGESGMGQVLAMNCETVAEAPAGCTGALGLSAGLPATEPDGSECLSHTHCFLVFDIKRRNKKPKLRKQILARHSGSRL